MKSPPEAGTEDQSGGHSSVVHEVEPRLGADIRELLEDAPVGIHWVDAGGIVIWANRTELEMLGYDRDEYIGRHIADFHVDGAVIADILRKLQNGETLKGQEARLRHKDGSIRIASINSNVVWNAGEFVHTRCFTRDITEVRRAEEKARAQFGSVDNIYRTVPIGLALLDKEFRFIRVSERLAEINGISADQHLGRTMREVVPGLADQAEVVFRYVMRTGNPVLNLEFQGETGARPGESRIWNVNYYPIKDANGAVIGMNVGVEEITERKRAEFELAESVRVKDALYRLTDRMHRAKSLDDVYDAALSAITAALRCNRASILLFDETDRMRFVARRGLSDNYCKVVEGPSPWTRHSVDPQAICIDDVDRSELNAGLKGVIKKEGIGSLAFIPLVASGQLIGKFMIYFDAPRKFVSGEVDLCLSIARQLAFGIEHKRAEQALRDSELRFRQMIDALPAVVYTTDASGRLTHFNAAAVEFSGRVPELGTDMWCVSWKLYHADGTPLPHDQCPMATALKEGKVVRNVEAIAERPDGTYRWFVPYPTPLYDETGRLIGGINMLIDITDRKIAEQALSQHARQLALISDTAPVYIAYCDVQSHYKFVNRAYAERFAMNPEDCIGRHIADLLGRRAYESLEKYIEVVLRGEKVEFDVTVPYASLGERFMHCSYAPECDAQGRVIGWVSAITDITERKRVEEALQTSEGKLKETDRRKDEFLAMLAHELRNPLAPIANAVHLLRTDKNESPMQQQARAIIERQTGRLSRLVDDLLEVSRITTGRIRLHMEPIAIGGVVERAVETVRPLLEQHRHQFTVSVPKETLWLCADAARLEQVVVNLLANAVKFTDSGGSIELRVQAEENQIILRVKDTGIGISAELLPHVFDLFTQSERSLDRSHGGLGIGLSLVQRLVSMHGGSVTADSEVGKGSEFTVRLPLTAAPASEAYQGDLQTHDAVAHSLRVLVVDDNADAAHSLAMLLEVSGHVVWIAHDGMTALEAAAEYRPHVVILDIGLPKLDGYAVAERLRREPASKDAVLVAVTGYGQAADRERTLRAGFDRHLVKPVDFSVIEDILMTAAKNIRS